MAQSEGVAGVDSFVLIGQESTFDTEQTTVATHLGLITDFQTSFSNSKTDNFGFKGTTTGGRNVAKVTTGLRAIGNTISMNVINWEFLEYVLGSKSGSGTITYSESNLPPSFTMHRCIDNPGAASTDQDAIWTGSVVDSVTIRCSVGNPVEVSLNTKSAYRKNDTTILSEVALPSVDLFTFAGADVELPNGSSLPNIIDSVEITIANNFNIHGGLGSVHGKKALAEERNYTIKFSVKYLNNDLIEALMGGATPGDDAAPTEYATIECNFVKGGDSLALLFNTFVFDDGQGREQVNKPIDEELTGTASSCTATEVQA